MYFELMQVQTLVCISYTYIPDLGGGGGGGGGGGEGATLGVHYFKFDISTGRQKWSRCKSTGDGIQREC